MGEYLLAVTMAGFLSFFLLGLLTNELFRSRKEVKKFMGELADALGLIATQLAKAKDEIVAKIAELIAALANAPIPDDAKAKIEELKTLAVGLDDIVPDAPPAEPPV